MKDAPGVIYLAVNRHNQKAYVGQTTKEISHRINTHAWRGLYWSGASYFQRALAKYGIESFDFAVIDSRPTKTELNIAEREWISRLGSIAPVGYNIGSGGEGSLWDKRSEAWHAAVRSEESRRRHSVHMKAWRAAMTPEERAAYNLKTAEARRKAPMVRFFGEDNHAKKPENRVKISEGLRRSWQDPEVRARRAAAQKRGAS